MPVLFAWIDRWLTWLVASGLIVGVLVPPLAAALKAVLPGLMVIVIALPLLRLLAGFGPRVLLPDSGRAVLLAWCVPGAFASLWLIGGLLPFSRETLLILLLVGASPPLLAAPAFAQMIGLDARDIAFAGLAGTLLVPLSLPLCLAISGPGIAEFDLMAIGGRFLLLVVLAVVLAGIVYRLVGTARLLHRARPLGRFGALILFLVGIALMDGVPVFFRENPGEVVFYAVLAFAVNLGLQGFGYLVFRVAGRRAGLAAAIAGGNRNLAVTLAAVGGAAPAAFEVYVAMGQLPIFLLPALLAPLYRRLNEAAPNAV